MLLKIKEQINTNDDDENLYKIVKTSETDDEIFFNDDGSFDYCGIVDYLMYNDYILADIDSAKNDDTYNLTIKVVKVDSYLD